ncbi:MAG: hypothetical protein WC648_00360 [Candidatus Paceibacterota bacterium]|jgi:ribulose-phosphate 3-epimerase
MKKTELIPAILPKDFDELEYKVGLVKGFVKTIQVDICDGQFVQNATWPYKKSDESFEKILKEEQGMPDWQDVNYEFDLMVNRPEEIVEEWLMAGAMRIVLHVESRGDILGAIEKIGDKASVGLALNIETPIDVLDEYIGKIEFVQCMGIGNIGFQGQKFDDRVIDKIKEIRTKYPEMIISVDGGVTLESAPILVHSGANRIIVGSAIYESENAVEAVQKFKRAVVI